MDRRTTKPRLVRHIRPERPAVVSPREADPKAARVQAKEDTAGRERVWVRCAQPAAEIATAHSSADASRAEKRAARRLARQLPERRSAGNPETLTRLPDSLVCSQLRYYRNALNVTARNPIGSFTAARWKIDQFFKKLSGFGRRRSEQPRPKLCPSCGTLVGARPTRCHQCGASMRFSMAAASRSLGRLMPATSPATYAILTLSCLLFFISLLRPCASMAFKKAAAVCLGLFNFGGISGEVLQRLGASCLCGTDDLTQPWRFVTAMFLHGSLLHIVFNMWVLMDIGPQIEELYGSARYLFIYVVTGIGGYVLSSFFWTFQRRRVGSAARADRRAAGDHHGPPQRRHANAAPAGHPLADLHRHLGIVLFPASTTWPTSADSSPDSCSAKS